MKKTCLLLGIVLVLFNLSCDKEEKGQKVDVKRLTVGNILRFGSVNGNSSELFAPIEIGELPGGGSCNCNGHGGSSGGILSWTLATCRSNCTRVIGFRCGREGILFCQDGTTIICTWGSNCPSQAKGTVPERDMEASYMFYDNGTMKLTFNKQIPDLEKNAANGDIFEVESTDYVPFSSAVSVDGVYYTGFDFLQGNYHIDYTDGQYGSVVIGIQLKQ